MSVAPVITRGASDLAARTSFQIQPPIARPATTTLPLPKLAASQPHRSLGQSEAPPQDTAPRPPLWLNAKLNFPEQQSRTLPAESNNVAKTGPSRPYLQLGGCTRNTVSAAPAALNPLTTRDQRMAILATPPAPEVAKNIDGPTKFRFTSRSLIITTAFIALGLALIIQNQRLSETRAALSRYESTTVPVALAPGQFRVIVQPIASTDDAKVVKYRIECADERFVTVSGQGGGGGSLSRRDPNSGLYVTDCTLFADHLDSHNTFKMILNTGGGQGTTVETVGPTYALKDQLSVSNADGVYSASETPALFTCNGETYSVSVK